MQNPLNQTTRIVFKLRYGLMIFGFIDKGHFSRSDRYRYNAMLADKGISIRERLDPDNQYRCLYDFDEQNGVIEILLFVSTKQDLEKMLYRYLVVK
jgi:hypothetical protein